MNLPYAIERHREPLLTVIAGLYAMIGLAEGGSIERLKLPIYRAVLALLRPAESAARRLIIFAAQGLEIDPQTPRKARAKRGKSGKRKRSGHKAFPLFDPRVRLNSGIGRPPRTIPRCEPRIRSFHVDPLSPLYYPRPIAPPPQPKPKLDGTVKAKRLCRRLAAIMDALKDINRQAKRYVRLQARLSAERNPKRDTILRRGPPPGLREKSKHPVHEILKECHWLARSLPDPNSS